MLYCDFVDDYVIKNAVFEFSWLIINSVLFVFLIFFIFSETLNDIVLCFIYIIMGIIMYYCFVHINIICYHYL